MDNPFLNHNCSYPDPEQGNFSNTPVQHEECSDDRPSNENNIPEADTCINNPDWSLYCGSSTENSKTESQIQERSEIPDDEPAENQKHAGNAIMPPKVENKEEQKPEDSRNGSGGGKDDRFDRLEAMIASLFEKVEEFQVTIDKQQDIIKKQKREIERYHDDEVNKKIRQPILLDLIEVMDSMDMALEDYDRNPQVGVLVDQMEAIRKLMKATLENYNVREVDDAEKQPTVVSRRQQVVGRDVSDNPELFEIAGEQVNSFYKRERAGYVMCDENVDGEPRETVLRPEDVIRVVYRARED